MKFLQYLINFPNIYIQLWNLLSEKEDISQSDDQEPKVIEHLDPEIEKKKPPNDKIIFYKIVEDNNNSNSQT